MTHLFVLGAMSIVFGAASGYFNARGKQAYRLVAKFVASILFFSAGIGGLLFAKEFSPYAILVLFALLFGVLGDVFLCISPLAKQENKLLFDGLGLVSFLVGHVVYITVFFSVTSFFNLYLLPLLLVLPAALIVMDALKIINLGKLAIPSIIYSFVLGLMMVSAVNYYICMPSAKSLMAMVGGILFALSDSVIAYRKFGNSNNTVHVVLIFTVLLTYYPAQTLFALTLALA